MERIQNWFLAFDIESSGPRYSNDILSLGCAVRDNEGKEIDRLLIKNYYPSETNFEKECLKFWEQNLEVLKSLTYTGKLTKEENTKRLIKTFMDFLKKYQLMANKKNVKLIILTDNKTFDCGFINFLIDKYLPESYKPLPFNTISGNYDKVYETNDFIRAILSTEKGDFNCLNNYNELLKVYNFEECNVPYTHLPDDDSSVLAYTMFIIKNIIEGKIKKRN